MSKQISATYVDHMGSDLTVVNAARVSYGASSEEFSARDGGLVKFLAEHHHKTPFRHPQVELRCRAPIFLARQLGKHQVGFSWNEISRRYKDGEAIEVECYVPTLVLSRPASLMKDKAQPMPQDIALDFQYYIANANKTAVREYIGLIKLGVAPEQARMVLPQSMITEWIWTGSLFGFAEVYNQRSGEHAQYEANLFADELNTIMSKLFPICWKALTNKD